MIKNIKKAVYITVILLLLSFNIVFATTDGYIIDNENVSVEVNDTVSIKITASEDKEFNLFIEKNDIANFNISTDSKFSLKKGESKTIVIKGIKEGNAQLDINGVSYIESNDGTRTDKTNVGSVSIIVKNKATTNYNTNDKKTNVGKLPNAGSQNAIYIGLIGILLVFVIIFLTKYIWYKNV